MTLHIRSEMPDQQVYAQAELARYPYLFRCNHRHLGCIESLAARTIEDVERHEQTHVCKENPMEQPRHGVPLNNEGGGGNIPQMWMLADKTYDDFRHRPATDPSREPLKNRLGGMAEMIYLVMRPYYKDRDEVVREIMARGEARDASMVRITKGMGWVVVSPQDGGPPWEKGVGGGYTSDPKGMVNPPDGYPQELVDQHRARIGTAAKKEAAQAATPAAKPVSHGLADDKVAELKARKEQGFDDKMLCAVYKLTPAQLKAALAS